MEEEDSNGGIDSRSVERLLQLQFYFIIHQAKTSRQVEESGCGQR